MSQVRASSAVLALAAALALAGCAPAGSAHTTVTVFAAASLTDVLDEIAADFEQANPGYDVVLNYGGSAALAQQLIAGAHADLFAAASAASMRPVLEAGLADGTQPFASNTITLAVPAGNPGAVRSLADLARPELAIALCAPEVPCGAAAAAVLERAGVAASVDTLEQDVRAVLTRLDLGEVDAGLVYRTDAIAAGRAVEAIAIEGADAAAYPLAQLTDTPGTALFARWLLAEGQAPLAKAGFGAP